MKFYHSMRYPFFPSPGLFLLEPGDEIVSLSMIARNFRNHWGRLIREKVFSHLLIVSPDGKWGHGRVPNALPKREVTFDVRIVSSVDVTRMYGPQEIVYGDHPEGWLQVYYVGDTNWSQTFWVSPETLEQVGLPVPKEVLYGNVVPELRAFTFPEPLRFPWGYIYVDPDEQDVFEETFEYATRFVEPGVAVACKKNAPYGNGWGILNSAGEWVVAPIYFGADIREGRVLVKKSPALEKEFEVLCNLKEIAQW